MIAGPIPEPRMPSPLWLYGITLAFIIAFVTVTVAIVAYDVHRHDMSLRDRQAIRRQQGQIVETQERMIMAIRKMEEAVSGGGKE